MLRSWAVPKGLPAISSQDRLAIAVEDHDLDHATYTDEHKSIADHGWWQVIDRDDRRIVLDLHGTTGTSRYALIHTGRAAGRDESRWLLHRVRA